jgi:hypothetical protein
MSRSTEEEERRETIPVELRVYMLNDSVWVRFTTDAMTCRSCYLYNCRITVGTTKVIDPEEPSTESVFLVVRQQDQHF